MTDALRLAEKALNATQFSIDTALVDSDPALREWWSGILGNALAAVRAALQSNNWEEIAEKHRDGNWWLVWDGSEAAQQASWNPNGYWWWAGGGTCYPTHAQSLPLGPGEKP